MVLENTVFILKRVRVVLDQTWTTVYGAHWCSITHWGRVTHICVSKVANMGSDNGLPPGRRQVIIWTNVGILLSGPLATNFSEILIEVYIFSLKNMYMEMSSGNRQSFCLGLNMSTVQSPCNEAIQLGFWMFSFYDYWIFLTTESSFSSQENLTINLVHWVHCYGHQQLWYIFCRI